MLKEKTKVFILGILAGILIGIGGFSNLYCNLKFNNPILGGVFFSFGLIFICFTGLNLFTGKVGYIFENKLSYFIDVLIMMAANFIGVMLVGLIFAKTNTISFESLTSFISKKIILTDSCDAFNLFLMSIVAGALVFLAVEGYKKFTSPITKLISIMLPIAIMVIIGGEHSVANGFYYFGAIFNISEEGYKVFLSVLISVAGNIIGSLILWSLFALVQKLTKKENKSL